MNQQLLDLVLRLTLFDKKKLSQKALKAAEEVGELAKAILPFEDADGCQHKFSSKENILEEVADVILTVSSIAYSLDFTQEDIEEMLMKKAIYWNELQVREADVKYPHVPFEIHITVKNTYKDNATSSSLEYFKDQCKVLGVKPVLLDLQNKQGDNVMNDLMTSSVYIGTNSGAYHEAKYLSELLNLAGYETVRLKIETVPWHQAAPSKKHNNPIMPKNCYFESHFGIITNSEKLEILKKIAIEQGAHLSKNVFKKFDDGSFKIMLTKRKHSGVYEDFKLDIERIESILKNEEFELDKTIIEFSIFDTKISHDAEWLK